MLFKKLWRTMGQYKAQFVSMIIMIALGIGVFVGFNMEWKSIEINTERFYEETAFADFRLVSEKGFLQKDLEKISAIEGVEKAGRYLSFTADVAGSENKSLSVAVTENPEISFFALTSGNKYDKNDVGGLWLSDSYAAKNGVKTGDEITLSFRNVSLKFTVRGLIKSSEYMICTRDESQLMPDYETFGFAYISPAAYAEAYDKAIVKGIEDKLYESEKGAISEEERNLKRESGVYAEAAQAAFKEKFGEKSGTEVYSQINVISGMEKSEMKAAVNAALNVTTIVLGKDETTSYAGPQGEVEEGKTMGSVLPVLFLLIAVLTMVTTMHRLTAKEKTQIGTLKALGFKDKRITAHYTSYALMIGLIGSVAGIALGYGIAYFIMNPNGMMGTYLDMPYWNISMPWFCAVAIAAIIGLLTFIGFLSVKQMLKGTAAEALRPYAPKKVKKLAIEKTKLWNKFSFGTKWNLRDVMRHKSRTFMSFFGIVGCTILLVGALGMNDTMQAFLNDYYNDAMNYSSRIYLSEEASEETAESLTELFKGDYYASVAVEAGEKAISLDVYSVSRDKIRFPASGKSGYVTLSDEGAYICERIAKEFRIGAGDELEVSPFGESATYKLKIAGVVRSVSESAAITPAYAEKIGLNFKIDSIYTDSTKKEINAEISKNSVAAAAVKNVREKKEIVKSFDTFTELLKSSITVLIAAAVVLGLVVLYNLGVMSYTERYREMATLKVVGFKDKKIGGLLIGQNLWVTLAGVIIGIPCAIGVLEYLITALAKEYEMKLAVSVLSLILSAAMTFAVSLVVSLLIAKKNKKINMVEALKFAE